MKSRASEQSLPEDLPLAMEDLEEEWDDESESSSGMGVLPWVALLFFVASTAGIGMGLSSLFSASSSREAPLIAMPEWLDRSDEPNRDVAQQTEPDNSDDVEPAPLRGTAPQINPRVPQASANLTATRDLAQSPELASPPLRRPQQEAFERPIIAEPVYEEPVFEPAFAPSETIAAVEPFEPELLEVVPPDGGPLDLGESRGEGTYLVLVSYQNDATLAQAQAVATDAFLKQVSGSTYVQVASFSQLEYARHMADELQAQGLDVTITQ